MLGPFSGRTASGHGIRIVNDGSIKTLISYHRQVLKGWMISRKVSAAPKPSNQPFQLTPVRGVVGREREGMPTPFYPLELYFCTCNSVKTTTTQAFPTSCFSNTVPFKITSIQVHCILGIQFFVQPINQSINLLSTNEHLFTT